MDFTFLLLLLLAGPGLAASQLPPNSVYSYLTAQQTQQIFAANPQLFGSSPQAAELGVVAVMILGVTKPLSTLKTPFQVRAVSAIITGLYDTLAAYDPIMIGRVTGATFRRPPSEHTLANQQTAAVYAAFKIFTAIIPSGKQFYVEKVFSILNLDETDESTDPATATGIGNLVGNAVVKFLYSDGTNQLGDKDKTFFRKNYSNYTGYYPKNTAYKLSDPTKWQPLAVPTPPGDGYFSDQEHSMPQLGISKLFSLKSPTQFPLEPPFPTLSYGSSSSSSYRQQADEVINISASLNDYIKMEAEFFDDKIISLGFVALFTAARLNFGYKTFIQFDFGLNMAAYDAMVAVWKYKIIYDAVRPVSAIRLLYNNKKIRSWGGPGKGTVTMLGREWESYLTTGSWSEYPSGTSAVNSAVATFAQDFLKSPDCGMYLNYPPGISFYEPGVTPKNTTRVGPYATWKDYAEAGGFSRLNGGVHFTTAVRKAIDLGVPIGHEAFKKAMAIFNGTKMA